MTKCTRHLLIRSPLFTSTFEYLPQNHPHNHQPLLLGLHHCLLQFHPRERAKASKHSTPRVFSLFSEGHVRPVNDNERSTKQGADKKHVTRSLLLNGTTLTQPQDHQFVFELSCLSNLRECECYATTQCYTMKCILFDCPDFHRSLRKHFCSTVKYLIYCKIYLFSLEKYPH